MKIKTIAAFLCCATIFLSACGTSTSGSESGSNHTHSLAKTEASAATCTQTGNKEYWYCSGCGKYFSDANASTEITYTQTKIDATGHTLTKNQAAANCTHKDNIDYWYCSACGKYFSDETAHTEMTEEQKLSALLIAPPDDGTLPTAYSGTENIMYMVYALAHQDEWHAETYNLSVASSFNTQHTWSYVDYKDGVCILSDIIYSSFFKSSSQTLYTDSGAYVRGGSTPASSSGDISSITWNDGEPTYYDRENYYTTYGLYASELSAFIINNDTVLSASDATINDDGTYTQSFTLNPNTSTYYYQYAVKTRGGLSDYPTFSAVTISFTFNSNWEVLKIVSHHEANVTMSMIASTNNSDTETVFTYGSGSADENNLDYYESYFKQYIGNVSDNEDGSDSTESGETTVQDVLKNGFSDVLSESGGQYQIDLTYGDAVYTGYFYAHIDADGLVNDVFASIDLRMALGETLDEQLLYCEFINGELNIYYSESFAGANNITEINSIAYNVLEFILVLFESEDSANQFLNYLSITETNESFTLILETDSIGGSGIGVNIKLNFKYDENDTLSFSGGTIDSICYNEEEIAVTINLTDAETITHNETQTPLQ